MEAPQVSTNRRMDKENIIYTMNYDPSINKNEIPSFVAVWTDLENIRLSEISQTEKDKYCMISVTCGI